MRTMLLVVGLAAATSCSAPSQPDGGGSTDNSSVASVSITPSPISLQAGKTLQINATARDAAGTPVPGLTATWSTSDTSVAKISTTGMLSARKEGSGSVHVEIGGKSADAPVTITKVPVASVEVSPNAPSVGVGSTVQFSATALDAGGNYLSGRDIVWSSSNTAVATISAAGVAGGVTAGTVTIKATSEGVSGQTTLVVSPTPPPPPAPVATVSVTLAASTLTAGQGTVATAVTKDAGGNVLSGRAISWSSSNTSVATVNASGTVTSLAAGTTSITATSEGKLGAATLTVTAPAPAPVATVTVTLGATTLTSGQTTQATAVTKDASGNVLSNRVITWSSSNTAAATVSSSGTVTAVAAGSANIVATSEGKTGSVTLTVNAVPVATVTVSLANANLTTGQTTQASAVTKDATGNVLTGRAINWSSSNTAVATVSASGVVSAVSAGSAKITATSESKSGFANLTVSATTATIDTIFYDGFESGDLSLWQDGINPSKQQVITDQSTAHAGSRYLQITYPANDDGGWLSRFFMPGYDSVYVRYFVRFTPTWTGSTKLLLLRGSRTDNQWSSFGQAGNCPTGTDFFATNIVVDVTGNPGPALFYSYFPAMTREADGVTCYGRFSGQGTTTYPDSANTMSRGAWHMVEFWVKLNTPGNTDGLQRMWVDGVLKGEWTGLSFRTSSVLLLNSVTLEASAYTTSQVRTLLVDDVLVTNVKP